ncbi:MAG: A/G-specific adenine glycosylase [Rhodospirillales bacterium]|nr:A/G-specific adenine glycosylase [Rhodospirillales bacterium]
MDDMRRYVLDWYDANRRVLPWRAAAGARMDPYRVWLSEVMLQQTTVAAVIPYFLKFTEKWPDVNSLAAAPLDDVLREWAGLGYYARARNLHRCAQMVADLHNGIFPADKDTLQSLPGIGDYTAGAIAAIAFDRPAAAMDGNIERVLARVFNISEPLPGAKKPLRALAKTIFEGNSYRPGDFVQGLMDLGATVCTPRGPKCGLCPLAQGCEGRKSGAPESLPRRTPKAEKPSRYGHVYWITDGQGRVLIQKREDRGLLGGMMGLPTSEWKAEIPDHSAFGKENPLISEGKVLHTFTHFHLTLFGHRIDAVNTIIPMKGFSWVAEQDCAAAMPSVFRKAVRLFRAR